ncbi:MAG TPA: heme-copper oxidase subunit III [Actinomycetota bacterium]|nr:heme-copper oxidase subunit III [Actinomycetota bacterium]
MTAAGVRSRDLAQPRLPLVSVGMVLFLGSELLFFGALFAAYFVLRAAAPRWPPPGVELGLLEPAAFTAILVASSGTMQLAVARVERGDVAGMVRWVWVTVALGVVFLAGQALGYARATFDIASGPYGSAFYAMTGFHALHVLAGLLLMLVVLGRAAAGAYRGGEAAGVEAVAYYWHFVDVVWIGLFSTIYLVR